MTSVKLQESGRKGDHFSRLEDKQLSERWYDSARRVPVPAGSLFLWSSRTVHQGWSGGPRLAQPVCWEPAGRRDERSRERKLKMAALGLPSTHWASLGIPHTLVKAELLRPTAAVKSTLRPVTLAAGVDVMDMWKRLQGLDWMKPLPHVHDV